MNLGGAGRELAASVLNMIGVGTGNFGTKLDTVNLNDPGREQVISVLNTIGAGNFCTHNTVNLNDTGWEGTVKLDDPAREWVASVLNKMLKDEPGRGQVTSVINTGVTRVTAACVRAAAQHGRFTRNAGSLDRCRLLEVACESPP